MAANPHNSKVAANRVTSATRLGTGGRGSASRAQNRRFTRLCWYVLLALIAVTWAVYGQTLHHDFVNFDDDLYVYDNPLITRGLSFDGISHAFTHGHARNWHPLTTITHMVDCQMYGLRAEGHHFTNVLLHTLGVILLFVLLQQMTGAVWRSLQGRRAGRFPG